MTRSIDAPGDGGHPEQHLGDCFRAALAQLCVGDNRVLFSLASATDKIAAACVVVVIVKKERGAVGTGPAAAWSDHESVSDGGWCAHAASSMTGRRQAQRRVDSGEVRGWAYTQPERMGCRGGIEGGRRRGKGWRRKGEEE